MQIYLVGGAVRDRLLGLPVHDRDWVVVGATPQQMLDAGYQPVGKDFPVFLHPQTHEEYALARTERKTAPGYHGFALSADPTVTLDQDLARRDITINAMAEEPGNTTLAGTIDPYGGALDLKRKLLRHITEAFAEDPVRILRVARFAARFNDFTVADETRVLMRQMVDAGEVDALVPERVWQELSRGLMEKQPSRMIEVLRDCGALHKLLPEVDALWGVPQRADYHPEIDTGAHLLLVLDMAAQLDLPLAARFACLCHDLGKATTPADVLPRHMADVVAREHGNIHRSAELDGAALLRLLERCDALRKPERFAQALLACECDARGRLGLSDSAYPQREHLLRALAVAQSVATQPLAEQAQREGLSGTQIGLRIQTARVSALRAAFSNS